MQVQNQVIPIAQPVEPPSQEVRAIESNNAERTSQAQQAGGARAFLRQQRLSIQNSDWAGYTCPVSCCVGILSLVALAVSGIIAVVARNENLAIGNKEGLGTETKIDLAHDATSDFWKILDSLAKNNSAFFHQTPIEFSACLENHTKRPNFFCDTGFYNLPANQTNWDANQLLTVISQTFETLKLSGSSINSIRPVNTDVGEFDLVAIFNRLNNLTQAAAKATRLEHASAYMAMICGAVTGAMTFLCCLSMGLRS